jgi:hypothetical protein
VAGVGEQRVVPIHDAEHLDGRPLAGVEHVFLRVIAKAWEETVPLDRGERGLDSAGADRAGLAQASGIAGEPVAELSCAAGSHCAFFRHRPMIGV